MAFDETPRFPTKISYGSKGGPGWRTDIVELDSGAEERVSHWDYPRHSFDAKYGIKEMNDLADLKTFAIGRNGAANGFRYKDFMDYATTLNGRVVNADDPVSVAVSDQDATLGIGDGTNQAFQLIKQYVSGAITRNRLIQKPVTGTTVVSLDDVGQGSGWTVDTTTGIVTFTVAPAASVVVKAGCEFDIPARFGATLDKQLAVNYAAFVAGDIPNIPIVEIVNETPVLEELPIPGAISVAMTEDRQVSQLESTFYEFNCTVASLSIFLPVPDNLGSGAFYFLIKNHASSTQTFTLRDDTGASLGTLAAGARAIMCLVRSDALSVMAWVAIA